MNLRQQIIQDRIENTAQILGISEDMGFLRFAHSVIVNQSVHAFDHADLVDGGQDKQIDSITIEQNDNEATVYILSFKNTNTFQSNAIIQMRNGLDWIFAKPKSDINTLANQRFRDRIIDYRDVQAQLGPSNLHVVVAFVTNGNSSNISDEFRQEEKAIRDQYDNGTFSKFELQIWGSDELLAILKAQEKHDRRIDADIRLRYDTNNPSLIKYHADGLKGLVCTASALEIANIVNADPSGHVFDSNIRRFLGTRGAVNTDIMKTCTSPDDGYLFWFMNNGITVVCDSFDPVTDPDRPHVKVKNMQIVNGCQTATTLALAQKDGLLNPNVWVLLRVYEAGTALPVDKIVLTTNNQNKIDSRDLRANDQSQIDVERGFLLYKFYYERKPHQYDKTPSISPYRILANDIVAQSYLAIVLKTPSDARRRKYKVWGDMYDRIFGGQIIEQYVTAVQCYRITSEWLTSSGATNITHDL